MKKAFVVVFAIILLLAFYRLQPADDKTWERTAYSENLGDAELITYKGEFAGRDYVVKRLKYSRDNKTFENFFDPRINDALDWINTNTADDAVILSWWDYGHIIRGYTKRDVVVYTPSKPLLATLASGRWDEKKQGGFSSEEKIRDVASALLSEDPKETLLVMNKYNATHLFIHTADKEKSPAINYALVGELKPTGDDTVIIKALKLKNIAGLELAYHDAYTRIYKLAS